MKFVCLVFFLLPLVLSITGTYETYEGCPVSKGILQFDMWNIKPTDQCDWDTLREKIKKYVLEPSLC